MQNFTLPEDAQIVNVSGLVKTEPAQNAVLQSGDNIPLGTVLTLTKGSEISLTFDDGSQQRVALGESANSLSIETISDEQQAVAQSQLVDTGISDNQLNDIEAIQALIESGDGDIESPDTAAGDGTGNEGTSFVTLDRDGNELLAGAGYDTSEPDNVPPLADEPELVARDTQSSITGTSSGVVAEDGVLTASGTLVSNDIDTSDTPTFTAQSGVLSTYGTFAVGTDGVWAYELNNDTAQVLAGGEELTETFTVTETTADGESVEQVVTVTITGAEDAPIITGTSTDLVAEDGVLTASGTLVSNDIDLPDTPTFTAQSAVSGSYGTFSVGTDGVWTYDLDNATAQSLAGGEELTETFTVAATTTDGESVEQVVTVTITGAEDAPVITGTSSNLVAEDGNLSATGTLVSTDIDASDTPTFSAQNGVPGTYGSFAVDTDGAWTYDLNNDTAQVLAGGEELTEAFTVTATTADGESVEQVVTVTITGAEDAPVITGTSSNSVAEDGNLSATGTLVTTDVDASDTPTFSAQNGVPGTYGTFAVGTDGVWTYDLNNDTAQSLGGDQSLAETFTVVATTADGESVEQVVTVTITGTEDTPVIIGTSSDSVAEDDVLTASGTLATSDVDAADTPTFTAQTGTVGSYGSFDVTAGGDWSYALDNTAAQSLAGGEIVTETFIVNASTADGESVSQTVSITVTGSEDAPVITGTSTGVAAEDVTLAATGTLVTSDADAADTPTFTAQTGTVGSYGSFDVTAGGDWTYSLDNTAAQSLAGGDVVTETFTVAATTADGESVTQTVTVTVTGAEDAPVITGIASGVAAEDGTLAATGTLVTSDADAADTPTFTAQTGTVGSYGSFDVTVGGDWTYSLDNTAAQSLAGGEIVTETFIVAATTADGESVTQTVTVTVTGAEDAPVITGIASGVAAEDGTLAATGTLVTSDADAADTPTFTAQTGTVGSYGSFDVTAGGDWSYALDNTAAQSLAGADVITETFTVAATTADGESVTQTVTVTVTGAEDAPVITGTSTGVAAEDVTLAATGTLVTSDADAADTPTFTAQTGTVGSYGSFDVTAGGDWTYSLDNTAAQSLAGGDVVTETFIVNASTADGESVTQTVTVTVTGAEDAPVITGTSTGVAAEDGTLAATGTLVTSDADAADTPTFTAQTGTVGSYGSFDVTAGGDWSYSLDNTAAQSLAGGDVVTETFTVAATTADGESVTQTVTVTVTGAEDAPVITGIASGVAAEDGTLAATGTLVTSDADAADTPTFTAQTGTVGSYGSFDVTAGGDWTYSLDNTAAQSLAGGEIVTETFIVAATTADGESVTQTVTVTVTGAEDAPVITGTSTGVAAEDVTLAATGTLVTSDADAADTPTFTAQTGTVGSYGSFDVTVGGDWTYSLDNTAAQSLAGGDVVTETFIVAATTADGESVTQTVTVTVTGAEDAPVITGTSTGVAAEDGTLAATGTLVTSDADAADTPTFTAQTGTVGSYGSFDVTAGGDWTYSLDNAAAQSLAGGDVVTETFIVAATTADGESVTQTVTVTVTGAEDAPVITGTSTGVAAEDGTLAATGTLVTSDADAADTPTFTAQTGTVGSYGSFDVTAGGDWTYSLDNTAAQSLAGGDVITETFIVNASTADGESVTQTVTVTVTGAEDAPVITGIASGVAAEDGTLAATGTLVTSDADAADTPTFTAQTGTVGSYGSFDVTAGGDWSYSLDNTAAQSLAGGEIVTETFTVAATTADGESVTQTVTVTVTGAEDAPVITGIASGVAAEDGTLAATGTLVTSDADAADTPTFTAQTGTVGSYGSFDVTAGGDWTYSLDNAAAQSLAGGDVITETFTVAATTADGESVTQTVTVTVTGAEDAPVITGTSTGVAAEDGTLAATGTLVTSDADAADTPTFTAQTGTVGSYGSFDVTVGGDWTYSLDNTAAQSLAGGDVVTETFIVAATTADGESVTQTVTVTVTGAEDAPVITGTSTGVAAEDGTLAATGTLVTSDADAADTPTFTAQTGTVGSYGSFDVTVGGDWTYSLDNAAAQSLAGGDVITETFIVNASTADGESVTQTVTVTVTGAEDAPVITGIASGVAAEDGTLAATGTLVTSDADAADTPTFTAQTGTVGSYGSFDVTAGGDWSYALDNTAAQSLAGGDVITETFTVAATTADGESVTQTVTVTVTGAEDAPVITGTSTGVAAEDGTLAATGTLVTSDADAADTPTFTVQSNVPGTYGTFAVGTDGSWTFDLNNDTAQSLGGDQSFAETFTVVATTADGESVQQVVTVMITGTEDAPVITGIASGVIAEDGNLSATGTLVSTDIDTSDTPTFTAQSGISSTYGSFAITTDGVWTYTLDNNAAQILVDGQVVTETYTVEATTADGELVTKDVTITINGANEVPIATPDTFTVDQGASITGNVITGGFPDSDGGDGNALSITQIQIGNSTHEIAAGGNISVALGNGMLTIGSDGGFNYQNTGYDLVNDVSPTFEYTLSDGIDSDTAIVTIGVNDTAPVAMDDDTNIAMFNRGGTETSSESVIKGNVVARGSFSDGPDQSDNGFGSPPVTSVTYNGQSQSFVGGAPIVIDTGSGILTIENTGAYLFVVPTGTTLPTGQFEVIEFTYTVQDADLVSSETDEGVLTINVIPTLEATPLKAPEPSAKIIELDLDETSGSIDTFSHTLGKTDFDEGIQGIIQDMQLDLSDVLAQTHTGSLDEYLDPGADIQKVALDLEEGKSTLLEQDLVLDKAGSESEESVYVTNSLLADGGMIISDAFAANPAPLPEFDTQDVL